MPAFSKLRCLQRQLEPGSRRALNEAGKPARPHHQTDGIALKLMQRVLKLCSLLPAVVAPQEELCQVMSFAEAATRADKGLLRQQVAGR